MELIKLRENENEDEDTLHGLEGVEFTFTSKTTGKTVAKIVTDKNGYATTASKEHPRGSLPFDTYLLEETKHPEGLKPIEDVYKRQSFTGMRSISGFRSLNVRKRQEESKTEMKLKLILIPERFITVSYTHLDVYKRQL